MKNNEYKFKFFKILLNQDLYTSGYQAKNIFEKLKTRFTKKFIEYLPIKKDYKLRKKIIQLIISYFSDVKVINFESYIKNKLPIIFYSKAINNYDRNIYMKCAASCFLEFSNYENIFLINSKIHISGYQHGGGYGSFLNDYFEEYEKSLCNQFFGWGLSDSNIKQTRYKQVKENNLSKKRIVWIESSSVNKYNLMTQPYFYLHSKNDQNIKYIYKEIKALNHQYFNLMHPIFQYKRYEKYRDKKLYGQRINVENLFFKNDIGIFDNCNSSLIYLFIENKIPFLQVISRKDYDRFKIKMKEWFDILYQNDLSFYNDEEGKLESGIRKIIKNDYEIPKEVAFYNEKTFQC